METEKLIDHEPEIGAAGILKENFDSRRAGGTVIFYTGLPAKRGENNDQDKPGTYG